MSDQGDPRCVVGAAGVPPYVFCPSLYALLASDDTYHWPIIRLTLGQDRSCDRVSTVAKDLASATAAYRAAQHAVDNAKAEVRASQDTLRQARRELADAIVAEAKAGTRMRDLVAATGLSREWIRTLLRQAGVMADD